MTIKKALIWAYKKLETINKTPQLDAEVLLAHVLKVDKSFLYAHPEKSLPAKPLDKFKKLIKWRSSSEPIAYLTGEKEFYGYTFKVNPDVLIPRPASEQFIDLVKKDFFSDAELNILDVGTGSGCLAITLAKEFPESTVDAVEPSLAALKIAKENAKAHAVKIKFYQSSLLDKIEEKYDVIVANLPYLTQKDLDKSFTAKDLTYEPTIALLAEDGGLLLIKDLLRKAEQKLKDNGKIYLEIKPTQISPLQKWIKQEKFPFLTKAIKDLSNKKRFLIVSLNK